MIIYAFSPMVKFVVRLKNEEKSVYKCVYIFGDSTSVHVSRDY